MNTDEKTLTDNDAEQSISVVIPVYRGEKALPPLCERLSAVMSEIHAPFEILFVEDCGGDSSWELIKQLSAKHSFVKGIRLSRNFGQHSALLCGIRSASGKLIVTMDDDLQHRPEDLPLLLNKLNENVDVIYGAPIKEPHGFFRGVASQITKIILQAAMGEDAARNVSAFRAFKTRLRDAFTHYDNPYVNIDVMLTWGSTRFDVVRVPHEPREFGESGYTLRTLMSHAFNMITGYSALPLKLSSFGGLVFAFFGFLLLGYVLIQYFLHGVAVPGFAFLASIIALFSGVQLLTIGIIGEYLARIHFRTMDKPAYVIDTEVGDP